MLRPVQLPYPGCVSAPSSSTAMTTMNLVPVPAQGFGAPAVRFSAAMSLIQQQQQQQQHTTTLLTPTTTPTTTTLNRQHIIPYPSTSTTVPIAQPASITPTTSSRTSPANDSFVKHQPAGLPRMDRKIKKPLMEKKRRARINQCLSELKQLLVQAAPQQRSKLEKADILEMTVDYLRHVVATNKQPDTLLLRQSYTEGYNQCAVNTLRLLDSNQDLFDDKQRFVLLTHLNHQGGAGQPPFASSGLKQGLGNHDNDVKHHQAPPLAVVCSGVNNNATTRNSTTAQTPPATMKHQSTHEQQHRERQELLGHPVSLSAFSPASDSASSTCSSTGSVADSHLWRPW